MSRKPVIFEVEVWNTETLGRFEGGDDFSYFRNSLEEAGWYTNTSTPGTDTGVLQNCSYTTDGRVVQRPIVDVHSGTENFIV